MNSKGIIVRDEWFMMPFGACLLYLFMYSLFWGSLLIRNICFSIGKDKPDDAWDML